jgi:hypothetical protein
MILETKHKFQLSFLFHEILASWVTIPYFSRYSPKIAIYPHISQYYGTKRDDYLQYNTKPNEIKRKQTKYFH